LLSPEGEEIAIVGLAEFCREHGLSQSGLQAVLIGRYRHSMGWRIRRPQDPPFELMRESRRGFHRGWRPEERAAQSERRSLKFIATTPEGEEIAGTNLTAFCKERGASLYGLRRILKGDVNEHRGWRIRRLDSEGLL
jgi:hypothetical protein